ncbi:hypothetical protein ACFL4V_00445 [Candidatus Latescibacterota bacterium]
MFIYILRFLLIFWIISILLRWFGRLGSSSKDSSTVIGNKKKANAHIDINHTGRIDDAEFEEINGE